MVLMGQALETLIHPPEVPLDLADVAKVPEDVGAVDVGRALRLVVRLDDVLLGRAVEAEHRALPVLLRGRLALHGRVVARRGVVGPHHATVVTENKSLNEDIYFSF